MTLTSSSSSRDRSKYGGIWLMLQTKMHRNSRENTVWKSWSTLSISRRIYFCHERGKMTSLRYKSRHASNSPGAFLDKTLDRNCARSNCELVQTLNSPFFPPHIGAEPWPGSAPIWGGKKGEFRDWNNCEPVLVSLTNKRIGQSKLTFASNVSS